MPTPKKQPTVPATVSATTSISPELTVTEVQSKKKKPVAASSSATISSVVATSTSQVPHVLPVIVRDTASITTDATATPATPATTATPATSATSAAILPSVVEAPTDNVLSNIIDKVNSLSAYIKDIQANLKVLSKEYDKQQKIIEKAQKKRQNAKNSPSGFAKPNKISDELCDFIGVPHGTEKSRTDITRLINAYVKEHNLNKPENKRFILPDTKLKKILNVGDSEEINYFILQKLISHHFPASASKIAAKVAV
jgi:chromatin remodeling complex protein RSC6